MSISYAPGSWILIAGREVNVLLPESEKQRAALVWAAIDSGAGFAEALDAIVSAGLAGLTGFALVANEGSSTRAVVRGDLKVELRTPHDTTVVTGSGTWAEQSVDGVQGGAVWAESAGSQRLVLEEGLVRAAGFEFGADASAAVADQPVATGVTAPVLSLVPGGTSFGIGMGSGPTAEAAPEFTEEFRAEQELDGEDHELDPEAVDEVADESFEAATDVPEFDEDEFDDEASTDDFGALGISPEPEAPADYSHIPPPPAFPPPAYAPEPPAAQAPEPVAAPQPVRLAFSHGDNVEVTAPVVVGRAPHPDRFSHLPDPLVVRVPSPHQEISGTHVAISPNADGGVQVTDLGSTNGTLIIRGGGAPEELRPGVSVSVSRGDVVDLGDSLTIRIV